MSPRSRRIKPAEPPKIQLDIHAAHGAFPLPLTQLLEADLWKALSANAKAVLTPLCNYHRQPHPSVSDPGPAGVAARLSVATAGSRSPRFPTTPLLTGGRSATGRR
jgi:hypothetical protein